MTVPSRRRLGKALDAMKSEHTTKLIEAAAPFVRVANIVDALPEWTEEHLPLRGFMPGIWPTVGDIRRLRDELVRLGWKP